MSRRAAVAALPMAITIRTVVGAHRLGIAAQNRATPMTRAIRCGLAIGPQNCCDVPDAFPTARIYAVRSAAMAATKPRDKWPAAWPRPIRITESDNRSGTSLKSSPVRDVEFFMIATMPSSMFAASRSSTSSAARSQRARARMGNDRVAASAAPAKIPNAKPAIEIAFALTCKFAKSRASDRERRQCRAALGRRSAFVVPI